MGKASKRKASVEVTNEMQLGVAWAAELIRHTHVLSTGLSNRVLTHLATANTDQAAQIKAGFEEARDAANPEKVTPAMWAESFGKALENSRFVALLQATINEGHKAFCAEKDPLSAAIFGGNTRLPEDDPKAQAILSAHRRLTEDKGGPGWTALSLFCFTRMVAVNAIRSYDSNEWTELTFLWFDLENKIFSGDGASVAKLLVKLDRENLRNSMAQLVGPRMLHGLAEAALNARETSLFA